MEEFYIVQGTHTASQDITSLKHLFQDLYEKSIDGMIIMQDHTFKDFNPALIRMFGYESKEALMKTHIQDLMPKYQQNGKHSLREMMRMANFTLKHGNSSFEWLFKKKDGTLFWCDIVLTRLRIQSEDIIHGIYRDITAKKELELMKEKFNHDLKKQVEEQVEKNRQKERIMMHQSRLAQMGEMINMIAHQWRQPLSSIGIANTSIALNVEMGFKDNDKILKLTRNISQYVDYLNSTIDDFRDFFKDNKESEVTTLNSIVESTLGIVNMSLSHHEIEIETRLTATKPLKTYANELKQVLLNIIKNAQDALIEKGVMHPQISIEADNTTITVKDNAGGIPENIMDKIFDPYFSTKTKRDGTGIGLYMSKIIIEEHCGGKLYVHNDEKGAVFTISFDTLNDVLC